MTSRYWTLYALLAFSKVNPSITDGFPLQGPIMSSFLCYYPEKWFKNILQVIWDDVEPIVTLLL